MPLMGFYGASDVTCCVRMRGCYHLIDSDFVLYSLTCATVPIDIVECPGRRFPDTLSDAIDDTRSLPPVWQRHRHKPINTSIKSSLDN